MLVTILTTEVYCAHDHCRDVLQCIHSSFMDPNNILNHYFK